MFAQITMIDYSRPLADRAKMRKIVGPYRWTPATPGIGRGFYQSSKGLEVDRIGSTFRLRLESASGHLPTYNRDRYITGWYGSGDTVFMPIIARLPTNRGFLAGWTMGEGMLAALDSHIYDDAKSAAIAAYSMAEYDAGRDREEEEGDEED
jgi:hypothetical protein